MIFEALGGKLIFSNKNPTLRTKRENSDFLKKGGTIFQQNRYTLYVLLLSTCSREGFR